MENRAYALAAGLFTVLLAVALVAAGLWFRRDDVRFAQYVVTTTSSVSGLKAEAPVRYRGVDVGRVEAIKIEPGASGRIHVRIGVQEDTPITKSTYAQLGYQGVTGLAYVSLNDDGTSSELLNRDTRALDRVLNAVGENPQSFVFGAPRGRPGPGEPGFRDGAR